MNGTEDYLDGLLNSVSDSKIDDTDVRTEEGAMRSEKDFMDDFENEVSLDEDENQFLKQFEKELDDEKPDFAETEKQKDDLFFENLDGIVNSVKQEMTEQENNLNDDVMVDTLGDFMGNDTLELQDEPESGIESEAKTDNNQADEGASLENLVEEISAAGSLPDEESLMDDDQDLMDLLKSDDDLSDIGEMLNADENHETIENVDEFSDTDIAVDGASDDAENKSQKKEGFFAKLSKALFGPDEDELEAEETEKVSIAPAMPNIEELSDENMQILQELGEGTVAPEIPVEEPQEDKKKKKEKKEKKKKEKEPKKEKVKKPKKEKKPKLPKEPDNTPPLPKVPVILIFVMGFSFLALVVIATNLFSYSNGFIEAENAYNLQSYEEAFSYVSGMEIHEEDTATYKKYKLMALVAGEYSAYQSLFEAGIYDMALDSLVKTVGRCEKYRADAGDYECTTQLEALENEASVALEGFGIDAAKALEIYGLENRSEYTRELYQILDDAGLDKVTE